MEPCPPEIKRPPGDQPELLLPVNIMSSLPIKTKSPQTINKYKPIL